MLLLRIVMLLLRIVMLLLRIVMLLLRIVMLLLRIVMLLLRIVMLLLRSPDNCSCSIVILYRHSDNNLTSRRNPIEVTLTGMLGRSRCASHIPITNTHVMRSPCHLVIIIHGLFSGKYHSNYLWATVECWKFLGRKVTISTSPQLKYPWIPIILMLCQSS